MGGKGAYSRTKYGKGIAEDVWKSCVQHGVGVGVVVKHKYMPPPATTGSAAKSMGEINQLRGRNGKHHFHFSISKQQHSDANPRFISLPQPNTPQRGRSRCLFERGGC